MNNRQGIRTNYHVDITINVNGRLIHAVLDNIGMGGLLANTYSPVALMIDDTAEIKIPLPIGSDKDCIVVTGIVTRLDNNRMAFRFLETDLETLRTLFNLVSRLNSDLT